MKQRLLRFKVSSRNPYEKYISIDPQQIGSIETHTKTRKVILRLYMKYGTIHSFIVDKYKIGDVLHIIETHMNTSTIDVEI